MNICVQLDNGRQIEAPLAEWVAAIITTLPKAQREALVEKVDKRVVAYQTPGSHILRAGSPQFTPSSG